MDQYIHQMITKNIVLMKIVIQRKADIGNRPIKEMLPKLAR